MIAHIAEACFWLFRYLERTETTARLVIMNHLYILDGDHCPQDNWKPIININGQCKLFETMYAKKNYSSDTVAFNFLTWEEKNSESIVNSFDSARENARSIRDTISSELWNALNGFWLWLSQGEGKELYNKNKYLFYERIVSQCNTIKGIFYCSMRQEEAFEFIYIGMMLERALQTTRILGAKLFDKKAKVRKKQQSHYWLGMLKMLQANESFLKCPRYDLNYQSVAEFLLFEHSFPRSVVYGLKRALISFSNIRNYVNVDKYTKAEIELSTLTDNLEHCSKVSYITGDLWQHLQELAQSMEMICSQIQVDYFYKNFDELYSVGA